MSPRSIRRASERRAQKEARNAQLSTGPHIEAGKQISFQNATGKEAAILNLPKTQAVPGLTGRTILLSSEDAAAYCAHIAAYHAEYAPAGHRQSELVQSLADTQWRLARIPALEMALYAKGRLELADSVSASMDPALLDLEIHLRYEKQFRNLQLQESRLRRRYTQEAAELRRLQAERKEQARAAAKQDRKAAGASSEFVFSTAATEASNHPDIPAVPPVASQPHAMPTEGERLAGRTI